MSKNTQLLIGAAFLSGFFHGASVQASVAVDGTLTALQTCPAYVSKKKRTNPGQISLQTGRFYPVIAANRKNHADWYRIRINGVRPSERWISGTCGLVKINPAGKSLNAGRGTKATVCRTAGQQDNFKLALSWQPAFCAAHRSKPECRAQGRIKKFTLHGLWPNKRQCGIDYGFCGSVKNTPGGFCLYPVLQLSRTVRAELTQVMPSAAAGSCLQRHEWYKHGTCQHKWSTNEYFAVAINLARQFNHSGIGAFMSDNSGKQISEQGFLRKVDTALGDHASQRMQLHCQRGRLTDVYITIPVDPGDNENLGDLMRRAKAGFRSNCGGSFRIATFGTKS